MGTYLNPGNSGFSGIRNDKYVDKSGLIGLVNRSIDTPRRLSCISRPRRFGKSFAAKMLCAYYDKSCDSSHLFEDLEIAEDDTFRMHLNRYDVIYLDMTNILGKTNDRNIFSFMEEGITEELLKEHPDLTAGNTFDETLIRAAEWTGNKFIMIIDEWDAPIREMPELQKEYLSFLRMLFKGSGTTDRIFAAAYMTGILPIKKDGSQSAISDFEEFTMVSPGEFAPYAGFTEGEVYTLCEEESRDFQKMKQWYDGYTLGAVGSVYNPNSVMKAIRRDRFESYWTQTSAADSLMGYIEMDYDGLSKTIAELLGGIETPVDTAGFSNDLVTFKNRDDVLTLLIHLGYLSFNQENGMVHVPNEEIRLEFSRAIRQVRRDETIRRVKESDQLIYDTVHGNADAVAATIEKVHMEEAPLFYHSEQALRSVIKLAYFSYKDYYLKFEELPAGKGYADIVYLPRKETPLPALLVELKWDKSADGAIAQIKERNYPEILKDYGGEILLVGISYDKATKQHTCVIERQA